MPSSDIQRTYCLASGSSSEESSGSPEDLLSCLWKLSDEKSVGNRWRVRSMPDLERKRKRNERRLVLICQIGTKIVLSFLQTVLSNALSVWPKLANFWAYFEASRSAGERDLNTQSSSWLVLLFQSCTMIVPSFLYCIDPQTVLSIALSG